MLSTENSCSSSSSDPAPNFSIRDYAFATRSKDIDTNWPFACKFLKVFLKHGIKDPLPPFEPPDTVRSRCKSEDIDSVASRIIARVDLSDERVEVDTLPETSGKKCKLVLKLSSRQTEEISGTVSDPMMGSKVCPVCKLFSSSSNTTLNAHIDQCLSVESDNMNKLEEVKMSSARVAKPRKKRLMVDIYKTASRCTLEDLDRRNGTTWARDLAIVAPVSEPSFTKKPRLQPIDGDEEVYVDSNGIKLRILSKSSDMPRKQVIEFNEEKGVSIGKKKFGSKNLKHMKLSSLDMLPRKEIQPISEKNHHADTCHEVEEASAQATTRTDIESSSGLATIGSWACSKRSDLSKKKKCLESPDLRSKMNLSWSTEDLTPSPRAKRVDYFPSMRNEKKWSSKEKETNGLRLKLSRSCNTQKSDNSSRSVMKAKKTVSLKKNIMSTSFFPVKDREGEKFPQMFRKRRSQLVTSKRVGEQPFKVRTPITNFSFSTLRSEQEEEEPKNSTPEEDDDDVFTPSSVNEDDMNPKISTDQNQTQSFDIRTEIHNFEAETVSAQESSACLTSHGETYHDIPLEISSVASSQLKALDREQSFSPVSTVSRDGRGRELEMKGPEQNMDNHNCCCARREFNTLPRLSSFSSYPSSAFAVQIPSPSSLASPSCKTPSTPNSVLRLMGKDLVVTKEEPPWYNQVQSGPSIFSPTTANNYYNQFPQHVQSSSPQGMKEVIVIDDTSDRNQEPMMQQRPLSGFRPVYPNTMRSTSGLRPIMPSPFYFQSGGQFVRPAYYHPSS